MVYEDVKKRLEEASRVKYGARVSVDRELLQQAGSAIEELCKALDDANNELANKSVEKVGHWIEHEDEWWGNYWECSDCHDEYCIIEGDMYYKHCPGCGIKMEYVCDE